VAARAHWPRQAALLASLGSHNQNTKVSYYMDKGTGKLGGNRGYIDSANEAARALADRHAAKVMDTIRPLRDAGRTLQQIADTLNRTGVATSRGGKWYATTVKNILNREL